LNPPLLCAVCDLDPELVLIDGVNAIALAATIGGSAVELARS